MRFAVNAPATRPVFGHRPPDGTVHLRRRDDPPPALLGAFTERLLVEHVRRERRPRRRLARLLGISRPSAIESAGRERRLLPGGEARALTPRGR